EAEKDTGISINGIDIGGLLSGGIAGSDSQVQEDIDIAEYAERWAQDEASSDTELLTQAMDELGIDDEGVVNIAGSDGDDVIDITVGADGSYSVIVNGEETRYSAEEAQRLIVDAGEGNDSISIHSSDEIYTSSAAKDVIAEGGDGNDRLRTTGGMGNDYIDAGGSGRDELNYGGSGADVLPQGTSAGADVAQGQSERKPAILINGGSGDDSIQAEESVTTQLFVTGGEGNDNIQGGSGCDVIIDRAGDNTISGGLGDDAMITGNGNDTISDNGGRSVIYANGGDDFISLTDETSRSAESVSYSNRYVENVINCGDGDDAVIVSNNTSANLINGDDGNDYVYALGGIHTINGGAGDDSLTVSGGYNTINGMDGDDNIVAYSGTNQINGNDGSDSIMVMSGTNTVHGNGGDDVIVAFGGETSLYGDAGNDAIHGGTGRDYIEGGDGDDVIDGGLGGDVIYGGEGNDTIVGGEGDDFVNAGAGNDKVYGDAGNDIIFGLSGDDEIYGGEGQDTIATGDGNDIVDAGDDADADIIRYTDSDHGHDQVLNAGANDDAMALDPISVSYDTFKVSPNMTYRYGAQAFEFTLDDETYQAFAGIVNDNLEAFACIEPGQELLTNITDSGHTVTFEYFAMNNGTCTPVDLGAGDAIITENPDGTRTYEAGAGTDSVIQLNPAFIDFAVIDPRYASVSYSAQNNMLIMAHEMCHAYNNATGTMDRTVYNNDTGEISSWEIPALFRELSSRRSVSTMTALW
ncbi:hypothetical protein IJT17_08540, partial [bacterium]|nr:hypothetical protein [bacterium]